MTLSELFRLDGKVAVVTGASSGLGVAFADALAEAGADVALGARRVERLADTAALVDGHGRRALSVSTDVADPSACQALVDAAMAEFGRVDILVNNAGLGTAVPATKETPEEFRRVIDINLNGCYWMAQACGRVMQPGSSIINISSVLGLTTAGLPRPPTPPPRQRSSDSPATWPSSGRVARAFGSTPSPRASSPRR
ncbi:SDR family NAD(P)-dependent oxidoreductase [Nocardioides alcanivorans]|uniref:SDR family NAD(P)-dependent oxidoreductase n=1 Tax=Nocardioides alcanivorans TaxID=2897352 RepID=UPI00289CA173|nr:SDR family NAD(P)-dependent oxidoreductase [Nocardioides alcanivorans]